MQEFVVEIEEVWSEYRNNLKAFLHTKVSYPDEVDDLLQEVLIKVYQNLHTVKSQKSIKSWLFQITSHTVIDFYRNRGKTADLDESDLWYSAAEDIQQSIADCIMPFILVLPSNSATLLIEIDIKGQLQKSYAQQRNISYSTLKSRVQKARGELRVLFEDCCHLGFDKYGRIIQCDVKREGNIKC